MAEYRLHQHPESSHQQIATLLRRLGRSPVLDVGAAQGFLGTLMRDANLVLDGVEPQPAWAAQARGFYRQMFETDIESADLPDHAYRVIVCADVLEHTVNPSAVLRRLRRAATEDALFVISLPNVAHIAVRLMLLVGRFPKMERGILDRTHLHFYTRATAEDLLRSAGLQVKTVSATAVPLHDVWPTGVAGGLLGATMWLQRVAVRVAPRLFAFQWILVADASGGEPSAR
jgi:2-polyprenyl-3-methyl-5-hydroxy-6-metoxy-1,4-benzoquinol methylase